ncbi:MAG: non-canonical purine NTP pyrophosphatase [Longimicrobiaceae bacterium]
MNARTNAVEPPAVNREQTAEANRTASAIDPEEISSSLSGRVVYFGTSSEIKLAQYREIFSSFGLSIVRAPNVGRLIEPQLESELDDPDFVVSHPLKFASRFIIQRNAVPYVTEDTMLVIDALSRTPGGATGLPGADTKNWWHNLGNEGLLKILRDEHNRAATLSCTIGALLGSGDYSFATFAVRGEISHEVRDAPAAYTQLPRTNPYYFHKIFIPNGSVRTFAEMEADEFESFDYRRGCVTKLLSEIGDKMASLPTQLSLL